MHEHGKNNIQMRRKLNINFFYLYDRKEKLLMGISKVHEFAMLFFSC
jgi:hypothetical protein